MPSRPPDEETPLNVGVESTLLDGDSLPQGEMYVRNNFIMPDRPPAGFDVIVLDKEPRRFTLESLRTFEQVETDLVLECAGNGRTLMSRVPEGTPWGLDGVSPISVMGVRLVDVLGTVPDDVTDVVFTGADGGEISGEGKQNYQFSIGRDLAQSTLPILATHIGGEPLTLEHGAPVRLIVPGHYAMKSVKWLTRIEAIPYSFQGHFVRKYRYYEDTHEPEATPVGQIAVRSVISSPADLTTVSSEVVEVKGSAWTGTGKVTGVEVSTDGGASWEDAELVRGSTGGHLAAVGWVATVELSPGDTVVMARATDSSGATQPLEPRWNSYGYANNVVQRVTVRVV